LKFTQIKKFSKKAMANKSFLIGSVIVGIFIFAAIFAEFITPNDPAEADLSRSLKPPGEGFLLGTDVLGRDVFTRLIYGARISFLIAFATVGIALIVGIPLGLLCGYRMGVFDSIVMRVVDIMLSFPGFMLAVVIAFSLGPSLTTLIIAIGIYSTPLFIRLVRASTLSIKDEEYVMGARAIGETDFNIIFRYILPNCIAPVIVQSTLRMGVSILTAAGLGFIGLGVQPPTPEWGLMISEARIYIREAPHLILFPGLALTLLVLGFNLMGDGLNDILNPRIKKI
jgi:peptide/nickel transport system permease protein